MKNCIDNVAHRRYNYLQGEVNINETISMSIHVSEEEMEKLKLVACLEAYASYSEFVRRTALIEAAEIIEEHE